MKKLPAPQEPKTEKEEVTQALEKTNTFADALDQVFKKIAVAELLLMAALSHYDATSSVPSDKLQEFTRAKRWLHNFGRCDEWNFCLTAGTVVPANQERP